MKKISILFILFIFLFSVDIVNAKSRNILYDMYNNLSDEEKIALGYAPNEYVISSDKNIFNNDKKILFSSAYPSTYDLRKVGSNNTNYAPNMRNQDSLGLCWAFSFNSMLESYLIRNGFSNARNYNFSEIAMDIQQKMLFDKGLSDGNSESGYKYGIGLYSLSDALLNWTYFSPVSENALGNSPSNGILSGKTYNYENVLNVYNKEYSSTGSESLAYLKLKSIYDEIDISNIVDSENFVFDVSAGLISAYSNSNLFSENLVLNDEVKNSVMNNIQSVKKYIMSSGAASTITLIPNTFGLDLNNIFVHNNYPVNDEDSYDKYLKDKLGHVVTIIGWDDNYGDVDNDGVGDGAWLIQNSWGESTVSRQVVDYFYLSYYDIFALSEVYGIFSVEENKIDNFYTSEISNNYEYDTNDDAVYSYDYYIGNNLESIKKIKLNTKLYDVKYVIASISQKGTNKVCKSSKTSLGTGIFNISFSDCDVEGEINISLKFVDKSGNNYFDKNDKIALSIYSTDKEEASSISAVLNSATTLFDNEYIINSEYSNLSYFINTDSVNSGSLFTYKVYDQNNLDISSNFDLFCYDNLIHNNQVCDLQFVNKLSNKNKIKLVLNVENNIFEQTFKIRNLDGTGEYDDPFLIKKPEDLLLLDGDYSLFDTVYFALDNDIDFKDITNSSSGYYKNGYVINSSNILLNGNGHSIKNYNSKNGGLFVKLANSKVMNLKLENANVSTSSYVGALANYASNIELQSVEVSSSKVSGVIAGGIVGFADAININNSKIIGSSVVGSSISSALVGEVKLDKYLNSILQSYISTNFIENTSFNDGYCIGKINTVLADNKVFSNPIINISENKFLSKTQKNSLGSVSLKLYNGRVYNNISSYSSYNLYKNVSNEYIEGSSVNNVLSVFSNFNNTYWILKEGINPKLVVFERPSNIKDIDELTKNVVIKNGYVGIYPNLSVNDLISLYSNNDLNVSVYKSNGKSVFDSNASVFNGDILEFSNKYDIKKYLVSVMGDINSDGNVDILDFKISSNYLISSTPDSILDSSLKKMAADVDGNNVVDILDFKKISNYLLSGKF